MNTSKSAFFRQSFVMTEQDLTKLHRALTEFGDDTKIEIECADGLNRKLSTLEELLEFENPPNKAIQKLMLSSRGGNYERSAVLRFMNSDDSNMWLTMEGPEEAVMTLTSLVEERLASMKPWYSAFAKADFVYIALALLVIVYIAALAVLATGLIGGQAGVQASTPPDPRSMAIGYLIVFSPFILGIALNYWRKSVFPIGVFEIGQGQKRHADKELLRTLVVVGFLVSLAAGIVVLLMSR